MKAQGDEFESLFCLWSVSGKCLPTIDSIEPYIFNGFYVVFWRLFNRHDNIAATFQKTVSAGARSRGPLLIEWETFACGFENQLKTSVFCRGVFMPLSFLPRVDWTY
jgi:hypothetical protein